MRFLALFHSLAIQGPQSSPLKRTLDKPFDEVHEVSDSNDDSMNTSSVSPLTKAGATMGARTTQVASFEDSADVSASAESPQKLGGIGGSTGSTAAQLGGTMRAGEDSDDDDEDDEEDESTAGAGGDPNMSAGDASLMPSQAQLYNPADYKHLVVSSEIEELFQYITRHKAADIELETKLKPFIPDYIPAVGEIDAFLKVPPPPDTTSTMKLPSLGLQVLDEPAANQSDPTVLDLSLRAVNKAVIRGPPGGHQTVGTIDYADKNPQRILKWVQNIEEVHRKKPPPVVHYSRAMPDIESLMQVWPEEFEKMLHTMAAESGATSGTAATHPASSPTARSSTSSSGGGSPSSQPQPPSALGILPPMSSIDCDIASFARMVLALMDIPVYDKLTESLHVLFTLYAEFQNHAYFQH